MGAHARTRSSRSAEAAVDDGSIDHVSVDAALVDAAPVDAALVDAAPVDDVSVDDGRGQQSTTNAAPDETRPAALALALRRLGARLTPHAGSWALHRVTTGMLVAVVAAVGMVARLLLPTPVGMADAGSGSSLLCRMGLAVVRPFGLDAFAGHIHTSWQPHAWVGEACGTEPMLSSMTPILWAARLITPMFGWGEGLDTRAVALVCVVVLAVLLAAFVALLPGAPLFRATVGLGVAIVFADSAFADMLLSPHPTAAALLGVLAIVVGVMALWRRRRPDAVGLLAATACGLLAVAATPAMVAWLPVLATAMLWRGMGGLRARGATRPRRVLRGMASRVPAAMAVLALAATATATLALQPQRDAEIMRYSAVFLEILPHSSTPVADLEWFGLDPGLASSANLPMSDESSAVHRAGYELVAERVTPLSLIGFRLTHPERIPGMLDRAISVVADPVLTHLGSYTEESGADLYAKDERFVPISAFGSAILRALPLLVPALQLVVLALGAAAASRRRLPPGVRGLGVAAVVLVGGMWSQLWAVMLTQGAADTAMHMLPVTLGQWLLVPVGVALAMLLAAGMRAANQAAKSGSLEPTPSSSAIAATARSAARPSP